MGGALSQICAVERSVVSEAHQVYWLWSDDLCLQCAFCHLCLLKQTFGTKSRTPYCRFISGSLTAEMIGRAAPRLTAKALSRHEGAMIKMRATARLICFCAVLCLTAGQVLAWGATGHRLIGREAVQALPDDLPAFLRTTAVVDTVGELAREPDRWKGAGVAHDSDRDPAHFLDLGDDGTIFGSPSINALPPTREAYDTALRAVGSDNWKAGYLPYSIIDGFQQLAKDFAYWRVDTAAAASVRDPAHRSWFRADRKEREALILRDLGALAHYVGDGSQPLHVSIHFNGWGPYPNPHGYTQDRVHAPFEGEFVRNFVDPVDVRAAMAPYPDCRCDIAHWTAAYLVATNAQVTPFYEMQKAGGLVVGDARGKAFATARLAAGASALRDVIVDAWRASATGRVGWPEVAVADVVAGKVDPYDSLFGAD